MPNKPLVIGLIVMSITPGCSINRVIRENSRTIGESSTVIRENTGVIRESMHAISDLESALEQVRSRMKPDEQIAALEALKTQLDEVHAALQPLNSSMNTVAELGPKLLVTAGLVEAELGRLEELEALLAKVANLESSMKKLAELKDSLEEVGDLSDVLNDVIELRAPLEKAGTLYEPLDELSDQLGEIRAGVGSPLIYIGGAVMWFFLTVLGCWLGVFLGMRRSRGM